MSVPGSNLLNKAFKVIARQTVQYERYSGKVTRPDGIEAPQFEPAVALRGSWQALPSDQVIKHGLDPNKDYAVFYVSKNLQQPERDVSGDRATYGGYLWEARSGTGWFYQDGWDAMVFERIGNASV